MLYTIPTISPHYGYLDTVTYFTTGEGIRFNNSAYIRYVHFISIDMTLGASAIPDSAFPYGGSVRTSTVKSSQGYRVKEWVAAFIAFYRSTNSLYPATPPGIYGVQNAVIFQLGGALSLDQCTLGAKGVSGDFTPGEVPTGGYIYASDCIISLKGLRIRGNEYWDFTGLTPSNARYWGFCTALIRAEGVVRFSLGGVAVSGTPNVDLNYNSHVNNIMFERTYYGADERNSGAAPTGATIGANEFNPWGSGENDSTRLNRGPSIAAIFYSPNSSTIQANNYSVWNAFAFSGNQYSQGFKGTLGSPATNSKPIFAVLSRGTKIQYSFQYSSVIVEAGSGTSNLSPASTPVDWADSAIASTSIGLYTSLNLRTTFWKTGMLYKLGNEVSSRDAEVYF